MQDDLVAYYGLPKDIVFCERCVMSNQRPSSSIEHEHVRESKHTTLHFDEEGVCDACRYAERKDTIDWGQREKELLRLLDRHRKGNGEFDCLVPGSGGKDSGYAAHILKDKYGMTPLTCTWPPILYTEYGHANYRHWVRAIGTKNIIPNRDEETMRVLTRLSIEKILHPFQTFILGQKNYAPKVAQENEIRLIFFGESEAEYGNPIAETATSLREKSYYTMQDPANLYLGGVRIKELVENYGLSFDNLKIFLPIPYELAETSGIQVHYLGYYLRWTPQEAYYYASEHTGFVARPFRTQGTYSKYNSIDDKIDDLHYYTTWIKFGLGRASYDASQEIRNKHLTRDEGVALVHKFDGEFPDRYFQEVMDYLGMEPERFMQLCDEFSSPHLWEKVDGEWQLRHRVS